MQDLNKLVKKACKINTEKVKLMKGNNSHRSQMTMFQSLEDLLNTNEVLYKLSDKLPWEELEKEFTRHYSKIGRHSKTVRLMVSLLLLKQIYNLGDETVVRAWVHNPYWQYFSGFRTFQWKFPIEPVIEHLKQDFRLSRNYLKGTYGDMTNVLLAAAYNLKKRLNIETKKLFFFIVSKISNIFEFILPLQKKNSNKYRFLRINYLTNLTHH